MDMRVIDRYNSSIAKALNAVGESLMYERFELARLVKDATSSELMYVALSTPKAIHESEAIHLLEVISMELDASNYSEVRGIEEVIKAVDCLWNAYKNLYATLTSMEKYVVALNHARKPIGATDEKSNA